MQPISKQQHFILRKANTFFLLTGLFLFPALFAQKNIVIPVETSQHALVLQTDKDNHPGIIYFGKKMSQVNDYGTIPLQYR
jgi:alpha-galactosidase